MLHVSIWLLVFLAGGLSLLISTLWETEYWPLMEMHLTVQYLPQLLKRKFSLNLKSLLPNTAKSRQTVQMISNISTKEEWLKMPIIQRWRLWARRKYEAFDAEYYKLIDGLEQKLADLGEIDEKFVPDFSITKFSFLRDWDNGVVNTAYVLAILESMDFSKVAETACTRRLTNFMHGKETNCPQSCEYIRYVREQMMFKVVPLYKAYLEFLATFFKTMNEIDNKQVPITWLEQIRHANGEFQKSVRDLSLNQAFREIKTMVMQHNDHKYTVGKNIIVFDEEMAHDDEAIHWIFGPEEYILELKKLFNVNEVIPFSEEGPYLKKLIEDYVK